jgi:regulatory protein
VKRALPSLKGQALALLARREHSRAEMRQKLLAHARKLDSASREQAALAEDPLAAFLRPDQPPPAGQPREPEELAADVDAVLDWLVAQRHLSEARFIESRVHARAARQGQALIRQELARHGLALDADTAQQLRDTERARAKLVWQKRFPEPATDATGRAKQMRFLAARGFSAEIIRRLVSGRDDD